MPYGRQAQTESSEPVWAGKFLNIALRALAAQLRLDVVVQIRVQLMRVLLSFYPNITTSEGEGGNKQKTSHTLFRH